MSLAPSSSPPSAEPAFDLDYSIHDFEAEPYPDSQFLFRRIEAAVAREGIVPGGRTLDAACGVGRIAVEAERRGAQGWGLEPSAEMLSLTGWVFPDDRPALVRGVAETLPFRDGTFDRIVCQGSLDHFVSPEGFVREAARVLRPDGRLVIALANYESLSCRLGRTLNGAVRRLLGRPPSPLRPYWEIPLDHYHRGDLPFVERLGGPWLRLERCYGVSLLWLLRLGNRVVWGRLLDRLPASFTGALLTGLDRIAYRRPGLADMIVSVWRPEEAREP